MKQTKNSICRLAVLVALFWLLPSAEVSSAESKVNIVYPGAVGAWVVPLLIAQEQGLFTKHGIDVHLVSVSGATVPRLTGEVPFGYIGGPAALNRRPYPAIERLKSVQKVMAIHEPKVLDVRVEELIADHFVRKLDESGAIDRLYSTYELK
jgi:ABC-type nitrate/sulfonate/bicarbonate transport system substrate-binding protein